jgi:hypothetical protein
MSKKDTEVVRRIRVRQLFESGPFEHTETGVLRFYEWLQRRYPYLLPTGLGDPHQHLKADLHGLYRD